MNRRISFYVICAVLAAGVLILGGCDLNRPGGGVEDAAEFSPPAGEASPAAPVAQATATAPPSGEEPAPPVVDAPTPTPGPTELAVAQNGAVIRFQPASQQLNVGDVTRVDIVIENVSDLSAADVQVQFDRNVLRGQDALPDEDGIQLEPGNFLQPDFVVVNDVNNDAGLAHYALTQVAPSPPASGTGVLATIIFEAIAQGDSALTFALTNLGTGQGQPIDVVGQPGQIIVGQPGQFTPTFTPTFTPGPGQPTPTNTPTPVVGTPTPTVTPIPPPTATPTSPIATGTPVPLMTYMPPGAITGFCYRVQKGDTLFGLGQQFGVDFRGISAVNGLWPPDVIYANQGLFIPQGPGHGPLVYIAQGGDTLDGIAEQCNLPLAFLADVNHLPRGAILQAGHVVIIPMPPAAPPPPPGPPCYYGPQPRCRPF